jgi:hypothetical protein
VIDSCIEEHEERGMTQANNVLAPIDRSDLKKAMVSSQNELGMLLDDEAVAKKQLG